MSPTKDAGLDAAASGAPSPTRAGSLELRGVSKLYGDLRAVDDVSLTVAPGEFISLLGPSGSGKTTTLRIVAGFIQPNTGTVVLDGQDLTRVPPYKRDLGMVFQNYALFPHMTAAENVGFPLAMRRRPKPEIKQKVEEALKLVHLEGLGERYPRQLSGGQQQRVALARALSFNPRLLLMDEPLGALDKKLREALQLEMMRISRQLDVTVLYVTHDQEEALVMSDRIAIYNHGRIEQLGTGEDLYERPDSLFVADFVGESNIFHGIYGANGSGDAVTSTGGSFIPVAPEAGRRAGLSAGDCAGVVVRPERIWIRPADERAAPAAAGPPAGAAGPGPADDPTLVRLHGRVQEVIYLGSDLKFVVRIGGDETVTVRVSAGEPGFVVPSDPAVTVGWAVADAVVVPDAGGESCALPGEEQTEGPGR